MRSLPTDIRYAGRTLARRPVFAAIAALTLALGIGATTAIYSVVSAVLLRPLPYATAERVVAIWERDATEPREVSLGMISQANFRDVVAASTSFAAAAQMRTVNITLTLAEASELERGAQVGAGFFTVFGAEPVLGRSFTDDEARFGGPRVAVVSHEFWQERLGGDPAAIGSTVRLQENAYEVIGIAPAGFAFPAGVRIWLPIQQNEEGCGRGCVQYGAVGLLRPDVTVDQARSETGAIGERLAAEYPGVNANLAIDVASLHEIVVGDVETPLFVIAGAVVMLLLIACANVANLMLVRGTQRREEMALRAVLGAGRSRLVAQLVTESAILAAVAAVIGVLLAVWSVDVLRDYAPATLPRLAEIGLDGTAVVFAVLVAAITIVLFGLLPALQLSGSPFAATLRAAGRGATGGRQRARSSILAVEVALSVCLLLGAGLLLRSLVRMNDVDPGFDAEGVTHFRIGLPSARYAEAAQGVQFVERVAEQLRALPGVEDVGFVVGLPLGPINIFGGFTRLDRPALPPGETPSASYRAIDPGYLPTMRIPIVAGRNFEVRDRHGAQPVAIVNQALADRYFPGEDPIGRQIDVQVSVGYPDTLPRTIVGVVGNVHAVSLTLAPEEAVYVPEAQAGADFGHFVMRSARAPDDVLRAARVVVAAVDPFVPLARPGTMAELVEADTARHAFFLMLLGLFAAVALVLAAVGMYSVVAFAVAQRTREIGLRMALGARAPQLVALVLGQGLRPALAGAAIGVVGALAASRILASLLFEVTPQDPLTYVGVAVLLMAVVALACTIPARRATRVPPGIALRAE